ncbi:PE-PPE domain-containing protein [Gordonia rubripertincta]|uniref:PE-PPE domain-containing protein n=1 Tax=Gordonia rubripertincta TaxID=36822 RepID=UPI0015FB501F|nr:PE-PPE domain-containing protein [Gordonia rubripertincta]QMU22492.1 PE-PPE domain-containing protein [Gordonia rubripertincta]
MIELLWCDGTWSRRGARSEASEALRRSLNHSVRFTYVDYPATFGPATGLGDMSAAESIAQGVRNLTDATWASDYEVIVGGYSQGAMVAYRFAREILPHRRDLIVRAVAALGNPHEPTHRGGRGGIAERLSLPRPLISGWAPGDPIADIHTDAPLRSAWDAAEWMSVRDFPSALRWLDDITGKVADGPKDWWQRPDFIASMLAARDYIWGTQHAGDYARHGHATRLARRIERVAA